MTEFLKIEFKIEDHIDRIETKKLLDKVVKEYFSESGIDEINKTENCAVHIDEHNVLEPGTVAVVIAVIGLATTLVELYKTKKEIDKIDRESKLTDKKMTLELIKHETIKLSKTQKQKLLTQFIDEDFPKILKRANLSNIAEVSVSTINN